MTDDESPCSVPLMTSTEIPSAPKFRVGQKMEHARFGPGRVLSVFLAENPGEVHEYEVRLKYDRYPAMLTENETWAL